MPTAPSPAANLQPETRPLSGLVVLLLIVFAVFIHGFAMLGVPWAVIWLVKYPYDSNGAFHFQWFSTGLACTIYLTFLLVAVVSTVFAIVRRATLGKPAFERPVITSKNLGLKFGPVMLIHPLILLLGAFAIFSTFVGEVGRATYGLGGNPARFVTSDEGVAGRASRTPIIFAEGLTDRGMAELAEHGQNIAWLRISDSPDITPAGLANLGKLKNLHTLDFFTSGEAQSSWGDAEANIFTTAPNLREVLLSDFQNLSDAWLDALPAKSSTIHKAVTEGENKITSEAHARFDAATEGRR